MRAVKLLFMALLICFNTYEVNCRPCYFTYDPLQNSVHILDFDPNWQIVIYRKEEPIDLGTTLDPPASNAPMEPDFSVPGTGIGTRMANEQNGVKFRKNADLSKIITKLGRDSQPKTEIPTLSDSRVTHFSLKHS